MISPDDPRLTAYLLDELDPSAKAEIEDAIADSPSLQKAVAGLRQMISMLEDPTHGASAGSAPAALEASLSLHPEQLDAIVSAAGAEASAPSPNTLSTSEYPVAARRFGWWRLATAAILLYAIGLTVFVLTNPQRALQVATSLTGTTVTEPHAQSDASFPVEGSSNAADSGEGTTDATPTDLLSQAVTEAQSVDEEHLERLVDQFNSLMDERRYPEAELIAKQIYELKPNSSVATSLFHMSRMGTRLALADGIPSGGSDELVQQLKAVESGVVPEEPKTQEQTQRFEDATQLVEGARLPTFADSPISYPDGATWQALAEPEETPDTSELASSNQPFSRTLETAPADGPAPVASFFVDPEPRFDVEPDATTGSAVEMATPRIMIEEEEESLAFGTHDQRFRYREGLDRRQANLPAIDNSVEEEPESDEIALRESDLQSVVVPLGGERQSGSSGEGDPQSARTLAEVKRPNIEGASSGDLDFGDGEKPEEIAQLKSELKQVQSDLADPKAVRRSAQEREKRKTWKPATASTNAARLSVGHHDDLEMSVRDTYVRIDGFRARVLMDCYYLNDRPNQLEGQFMLRLPADASLHYFAFGALELSTPIAVDPVRPAAVAKQGGRADQDVPPLHRQKVAALRQEAKSSGADLARRASDPFFVSEHDSVFKNVKAARVVPRQKAALAYEETVRRRVDPALVEWAGPGIFQTKVYPLLPNRMHRIVIGYDVDLRREGEGWKYQLELPNHIEGGRVEFDVAAVPGGKVSVTPEIDAFLSGERAYYRMDESEDHSYSVSITQANPVLLQSDDYFAIKTLAQLPEGDAQESTDGALFLLDTSWSQKPELFDRQVDLIQQILVQNKNTIRQFNVMMFNVEQRFWRESQVANNSENRSALYDDCQALVLEGATDLSAALHVAAVKIAGDQGDQASSIDSRANRDLKDSDGDNGASPNLFLLSDGGATWGETDLQSIALPLRDIDRSQGGGALFAYQMEGFPADKVVLELLARESGGAVFGVNGKDDHERAATAHRSRPWEIVSITGKGASDVLVAGGSKSIYADQELSIAGRGDLEGPLKIKVRRGKDLTTLKVDPESEVSSPLAARMYGGIAVDRLEPLGSDVEEVTVAFARQFRVPGRTCSMVMLETEEDYQRFNIGSADDPLVVQTTSINTIVGRTNSQKIRDRSNSKRSFVRWIESLENARNPLVKRNTALRLAIDQMSDDAFAIKPSRLDCRLWRRDDTSKQYRDALATEDGRPEFDLIMKEAQSRMKKAGSVDAIKVASTAVEANPADPDTLRAVSFSAIDWGQSDHAAPLLKRLMIARPYQPQSLLLLGRCMADAGKADAAMVCYELVAAGNWNARWSGNRQISEVALLHLLEQIAAGELTTNVPVYAAARLEQLRDKWADEGLDVAIVMHWNTDRSDVDLHVMQPDGEECSYQNKKTKLGGAITQDITDGLGPEMYTLPAAAKGKYQVTAKYYSSDNNRTSAPTQTLVTVYRNLGRSEVTAETKLVQLSRTGDKLDITSFQQE